MKTLKVRNVVIGEGIPKICVSVTGKTSEEILKEASEVRQLPADMAEWRIDWYDDVFEPAKLNGLLRKVREALGDMPLLITFRSEREGGEKSADAETYLKICTDAVRTGLVDLVDAELSMGDETVREIINIAHAACVGVVASSHDFSKTPDRSEMISRLCRMQDLGADVLKIAVMPHSKSDVLALISAVEEMLSEYADRPVAAMAMGDAGIISRITGEFFGSAITFGAASRPSAPGQISARELRSVLEALHSAISRPVIPE